MNKPLDILLFGELCHDITRHCAITRLSPEAPIPVLCPTDTVRTDGMAGNVRANLLSLGGGEDNVRVTFLTNPGAPILKTRYVDKQTGYIVARVDENDTTTYLDIKQMLYTIDGARLSYDAVVISDYDKGLLSNRHIEWIIDWAITNDTPVFMDTKKVLGYWSKGCTVVKINQREYEHNLAELDEDEMPYDWCNNLVLTLGSDGADLMRKGRDRIHVNVEPVAVADVTGAGDTHLAALALAYLTNGGNLIKAIEYANSAARIAVSKHGTVAVRADEITSL